MIKSNYIVVIFLVVAVLCQTCSVVPITGRKQIILLPESEMIGMALTSYQEFLKENPPSADVKNAEIVKKVGNDLVSAVQRYFAENNMQDRLEGYQWEFNLVDNNEANAWCMPGGKVVVYKGILPYTLDQNGLAVVISHEIAHAVARHGNERMSQQLLTQLGGLALSEALKQKPQETQNIFLSVYGLGSQVGLILPYSRKHEFEADRLGLIFMAMAGYDPESAVTFWEKMASAGGAKPPEFLSTHPSDEKRINNIKSVLPEAKKYYKK
ncbi:MAG: M48 family metallopeptidase [Bacteroidales bacterium]|nr:M48 family metallopeptidase [Bacteroidales bacterium]